VEEKKEGEYFYDDKKGLKCRGEIERQR